MQEILNTIRKYQEYTDAAKENLKYLKESQRGINALVERDWSDAMDSAVELLGDQFEDSSINIENVRDIVQTASLVTPHLFSGELIKREYEELKNFFRKERDKLLILRESIEELITLDFLDEIDELDESEFEKELNDYMNQTVPESGENIREVASRIDNFIGSMREDGEIEDETLSNIKNDLESIRSNLRVGSDGSVFEDINNLIELWGEVSDGFEPINAPGSDDYEDLIDGLTEIRDNLLDNYRSLNAAIQTMRNIALELIELEDTMIEDWGYTLDHIIKPYSFTFGQQEDTTIESFDGYNSIRSGLESRIESGDVQYIQIDNATVKGINQERFQEWKNKAASIMNNNILWRRSLTDILNNFEDIDVSKIDQAINSTENILSPLREAIIEVYEEITEPFWNEIRTAKHNIDFLMDRIQQGYEISFSLVENVERLYNNVVNVYDNVESLVDDIDSFSDGVDALSSPEMGAMFSGLLAACDSLGLSELGDLLEQGDIASLIDEEVDDLVSDIANITRDELIEELGVELAEIYYMMKEYVMGQERQEEDLDDDGIQKAIELKEYEINQREDQTDKARRLI